MTLLNEQLRRNPPRQRVWYANLLRRLATGRINNKQYDSDAFKLLGAFGSDSTLLHIYEVTWYFYCDFNTHRLTGDHALCPHAKRLFARMILLLRSGDNALPDASPDEAIASDWPFASEAAFASARKTVTYLGGKRQQAL